ncbi:MAG: Vps62-related protein, partial [candidate division Zixibacteria bacterium]|nr:Vps62-related protein [candidate division Zixibacteria bacterium]
MSCLVELDRLTRRFAPLVRFHPDEAFFPSSVEWYLGRVALLHVSSPMHAKRPATITPVLAKGQVDSVTLVSQQVGDDHSGGLSKGTFYLDIPNDTDRAK